MHCRAADTFNALRANAEQRAQSGEGAVAARAPARLLDAARETVARVFSAPVSRQRSAEMVTCDDRENCRACAPIGALKNASPDFFLTLIRAPITRRCARKNDALEKPLCASGAFDGKKSKRFIARLLRTDKVFVYFT